MTTSWPWNKVKVIKRIKLNKYCHQETTDLHHTHSVQEDPAKDDCPHIIVMVDWALQINYPYVCLLKLKVYATHHLQGRPGCYGPVWNPRTVIWFFFPDSSLVFFVFLVHLLLMPCPFFFANDPFSRLFSQKILKHFSFRVSCFLCVCFVLLFLSNKGWQLVEGFDLKTMIK